MMADCRRDPKWKRRTRRTRIVVHRPSSERWTCALGCKPRPSRRIRISRATSAASRRRSRFLDRDSEDDDDSDVAVHHPPASHLLESNPGTRRRPPSRWPPSGTRTPVTRARQSSSSSTSFPSRASCPSIYIIYIYICMSDCGVQFLRYRRLFSVDPDF